MCYLLCNQLCGLALAAIGFWMLFDGNIEDIAKVPVDYSSELLRAAAILLIVVGLLLFIISLLGIIGALFEYTVLLGIVRILTLYFV